MLSFSCFNATSGKRKKDREDKPLMSDDFYEKLKTLQERSKLGAKFTEIDNLKMASSNIKEGPVEGERDYEGEDEREENLSMKRDNSDFDFQSHMNKKNEPINSFSNISVNPFENKANRDDDVDFSFTPSGHMSDPGTHKHEFLTSPKLVRSCSFVSTYEVLKKISYLPPSKDNSYEELQKLAENSPKSVKSHHSADKVMLKKHSSSQILPSRSKRLWWKLYLWSHRNMPKLQSLNKQGGYCSDTLEGNEDPDPSRGNDENSPCWDKFHGGVSEFWPQKQWVAISQHSPLPRVDQWVQELANQPLYSINDEIDENEGCIDYPQSPESTRSPVINANHVHKRENLNRSEEFLHANSVIQSLNLSSTVAHITGVGLKVIPMLSQFSSLRSINLSGNSIAHITQGSLPKGLHILNLSRNKITAIEGLRDLTRLRVLDLSYNKISRIGHGLSNCTLIKELYLSGNKISGVEGLHRLLKVTILDLSFNKISTTKALGQLVANYNSLLALNLLGDPIQNNISDDQLRKAISGLLPKLAYLNKQPINSQKARELGTESIVKAAIGNGNWGSRKRRERKVSHGRSIGHRSGASVGQSSRLSSSSRVHRHRSFKK